jgi:DNA-directed RNA polymerase specialized sigma24 family protein
MVMAMLLAAAVFFSTAEAREQVVSGLEQLGEADREILLLRHYGELSFKEIASQTGAGAGTIHRALAGKGKP